MEGSAIDINYYDTFITVAPDCPLEYGAVPPEKKNGKTKPRIEYDLTADHPYRYTQEELLFETHIRHKEIPEEEVAVRREELWNQFFSKPMACLRASMLPKKYGWGIHFNSAGKLSLIAADSPEYRQFVEGEKGKVKVLPAMRSSRK